MSLKFPGTTFVDAHVVIAMDSCIRTVGLTHLMGELGDGFSALLDGLSTRALVEIRSGEPGSTEFTLQ